MSGEYTALNIIELRARDFRKLRAVRVRLRGGCTTIKGKNSQGKSTFVSLPQVLLGGKKAVPLEPIRHGARRCEMSMTLGQDGTPELIIKKTISSNGTVELEVTSADGAPHKRPQELLESLIGPLAYDPVAFATMDAKKQDELLREALGLDFSDLEAERDRVTEARRLVNREGKRLKALLDTGHHHAGLPKNPIDVAETAAEMKSRTAANTERARAVREIERAQENLAAHDREARADAARVEALELQLAELRSKMAEDITTRETMLAMIVQSEQALPPVLALTDLEERLASADTVNAKIRENATREATEAEYEKHVSISEAHTDRLEVIREERQARLAGAKFTIPGLAFDDAGPILNGVPLSQAGTAEALRLGVALVAAQDPTLRVVLVRNGDVLDDANKVLFDQLLEEHGMQALMEVVHMDDPSALVIEDGEIVEPSGATVAAE